MKLVFQYLLLVFCFFAGCLISQKAQQPMQIQFDKQGHRGCRGLMPENTVPAMRKALELNVTTLEMDVVITKDKKVVLSHDPWFSQEITTLPNGGSIKPGEETSFKIYGMNYADVIKYDVGLKPHPRFPNQEKIPAIKPLLADVIDSINQDMMTRRRPFPFYNIETKTKPEHDDIYTPKPEEFVELLMTVIKEKGIEDRVIIQSFDYRTLQYLHKKYPAIRTAALVEDFDKRGLEKQIELLGFTPSIYSPNFLLVNEDLIKACHDRGMQIIPWTINSKELIKKFRSMGVDGIITDYPDLFPE